MTYDIEGLEKLQHSQQELVIANHPTLVDVVVLIGRWSSQLRGLQSIVTNSLPKVRYRVPVIFLNAGSEQFIHDCVEKLRQDQAASLLIFPEGTRTAKGELLNEFQRGAANIAIGQCADSSGAD